MIASVSFVVALLCGKHHEAAGNPKRRSSPTAMMFLYLSCALLIATEGQVKFATASDSSYLPIRLFKRLLPSQSYNESSSSWSSLLTVDPTKILSTMVKRGGLLLPDYIEKELQVLSNVCRVDQARLNVVDRELELVNVTISMPEAPSKQNRHGDRDTPHALRVGRVRVQWDSYLRPCVEVEVEQIDILVEFTNMLLNRNNWDELYDAGFPPRMILESDDGTSDDNNSTSSDYSSFVRIGSVVFNGKMVVRVQSRPLDHKPLGPDLVLDFKSLRELSTEIRMVSEANRRSNDGRPGCTTDQLYELTKGWFESKLRYFFQKLAYNMATKSDGDELAIEKQAKQIASGARGFLADYAQGAGDKLQESIERRLRKLDSLIPQKHVDRVGALSRASIDRITDGSVAREVAQSDWFRNAYKVPFRNLPSDEPIGVDQETYQFPEDIMFPDW